MTTLQYGCSKVAIASSVSWRSLMLVRRSASSTATAAALGGHRGLVWHFAPFNKRVRAVFAGKIAGAGERYRALS